MNEKPQEPLTQEEALHNLEEILATWGHNPPKHIKAKIRENLSAVLGIPIARIIKVKNVPPP